MGGKLSSRRDGGCAEQVSAGHSKHVIAAGSMKQSGRAQPYGLHEAATFQSARPVSGKIMALSAAACTNDF